jgi:hypothetical protein
MGIATFPLQLARKIILASIGFIIGIICSLLFYEFVICEADFDKQQKSMIFLGSAIFLSLGFAFSRQVHIELKI